LSLFCFSEGCELGNGTGTGFDTVGDDVMDDVDVIGFDDITDDVTIKDDVVTGLTEIEGFIDTLDEVGNLVSFLTSVIITLWQAL
jgi:hypothetical protein